MSDKNNAPFKLDPIVTKQIDEMDKHIDRGGMMSLILIVIVLLTIGYWVVTSFRLDEETILPTETASELIERIETLEERVAELEDNLP